MPLGNPEAYRDPAYPAQSGIERFAGQGNDPLLNFGMFLDRMLGVRQPGQGVSPSTQAEAPADDASLGSLMGEVSKPSAPVQVQTRDLPPIGQPAVNTGIQAEQPKPKTPQLDERAHTLRQEEIIGGNTPPRKPGMGVDAGDRSSPFKQATSDVEGLFSGLIGSLNAGAPTLSMNRPQGNAPQTGWIEELVNLISQARSRNAGNDALRNRLTPG